MAHASFQSDNSKSTQIIDSCIPGTPRLWAKRAGSEGLDSEKLTVLRIKGSTDPPKKK